MSAEWRYGLYKAGQKIEWTYGGYTFNGTIDKVVETTSAGYIRGELIVWVNKENQFSTVIVKPDWIIRILG